MSSNMAVPGPWDAIDAAAADRIGNRVNDAFKKAIGIDMSGGLSGRFCIGRDGRWRQRQSVRAQVDATNGVPSDEALDRVGALLAEKVMARCPGATAVGHVGALPVGIWGPIRPMLTPLGYVEVSTDEAGETTAAVNLSVFFAPLDGEWPSYPDKESAVEALRMEFPAAMR